LSTDLININEGNAERNTEIFIFPNDAIRLKKFENFENIT
jgi:hypothetical protein